MDGILYLWLLWGMWIYTTFIMGKNSHNRFRYSFLLLILICLFPYGMKIPSMEISISIAMLTVICFLKIRKYNLWVKLYLFISTLTLGMFYAGLELVAIYDPVLMFMDTNLIVAATFVIVSFLFYSSGSQYKIQFISIILGSIIGEFLLTIALRHAGIFYSAGNYEFLDYLSITMGLMLIVTAFRNLNQIVTFKLPTNKGEMKNL